RWLEASGGSLRGRPVVVAGAGVMGALLAAAVARRQADLVVGSRSIERAQRVVDRFGGRAADLGDGAIAAAEAHAVAVALTGSWGALTRLQPGAFVVDLSVPPAIGLGLRADLGGRFADVDGLYTDIR